MSLENMNKSRFSPKKDYNANRLTAGLLQLTDGNELVTVEVHPLSILYSYYVCSYVSKHKHFPPVLPPLNAPSYSYEHYALHAVAAIESLHV